MLKIGIDVGGVLSKYPEHFRILLSNWENQDIDYHIISDMHPVQKILDMLRLNKIFISPSCVHSADYATYGGECKAVLCEQLGIDILIDDHMEYLSVPGKPLIRLLVMPDASKDYYSESWITDGSEGNFGRRRKV